MILNPIYGTDQSLTIPLSEWRTSPSAIESFQIGLQHIEKQWLLSHTLEDVRIIQESLERKYNAEKDEHLTLNTRALFTALHQRNIDFMPPPFPKILIIMINRLDDLLQNDEVTSFIQGLHMPSALVFTTPFWDLKEYKNLDPRELKGYLSEDYQDMMQRYSAEYLCIVHRDSLRFFWDVRFITNDREELIQQRCTSLSEVRALLCQAILSQYRLNQEWAPQKWTLQREPLSRDHLLNEYTKLISTAEICDPTVQAVEGSCVEYAFLTYWNPRLTAFMQKQMAAEHAKMPDL